MCVCVAWLLASAAAAAFAASVAVVILGIIQKLFKCAVQERVNGVQNASTSGVCVHFVASTIECFCGFCLTGPL